MLSINTVKERIYAQHGSTVSIDESTYTNVHTKARFIDCDFGEWWGKPYLIFDGSNPFRPKRAGGAKPKKSISIVIDEIYKKHGNVIIMDISTYNGVSHSAKFIDNEYGAWFTQPRRVINGHGHPKKSKDKAKKTNIKRYGTEFTHQNLNIALKAARSANNSFIKFHWKTNEELICQASYEAKTVDYLNKNQIDFQWQPRTFTMPSGKTYRPDLFLVNENKWIEIKGYMRKDAQEKWDWFHGLYSNSELWQQKKLKEMGVL